ncbi:MAG: beta-propeller domain-containing protein [Acidimicrobiia bacterium]
MRRVLAAGTLLVLSGCSLFGGSATRGVENRPADRPDSNAGAVQQLAAVFGLEGFASCDDVLSYLQTSALPMVTAWGLGGGPIMFARSDVLMGAEAAGSATDTAQQHSTTNLQEIGVDEPDLVKTDGRLLVAIAQGKLFVVDVTVEPELLGSVELGDIAPQSLFLIGDQALVIGSAPTVKAQQRLVDPGFVDGVAPEVVDPFWWNPMATIARIDLSDPTAPKRVEEMSFEGFIVAARAVENTVRLVVSSSSWQLPFVTPDQIVANWPLWQQKDPNAWTRAESIALSTNRTVVSSSTIQDWLPRFTIESNTGLRQVHDGTLADCGSIAHPEEFAGLGLTSILTFDASRGLEPVDRFGLVTDSQTVYASADAIYIATQKWRDWNVIPEREWDQVAEMVTTTIHRFDASDPNSVEYTGSGEVAGWLYSQWAMSEHEGVLRVASTTESPFWGFREASSQSLVTALAPTDGSLQTIGVVSGLGINERIYAVRFVGDAGYVVTFRQVDPLYVIDLSDPTSPQVAGELKIPGYSAYLHPIGENLLVGVGQDADLNGRTLGTQVAVFDVSDPFDPRQVDKLTLPGAYSQAEWDHHAFLYWPQTSTLVIPVQQSNGVNWWNGALAVHAGADGVRRLAEIEQNGYVYRTLVVGQNLLTLSDTGIQSYDLDDFTEVAWLAF